METIDAFLYLADPLPPKQMTDVFLLHGDLDGRPPMAAALIEIQSASFRLFFRARFRAKAAFTRFFSPGLR
jgi:hypothetical protein